MSSDRHSTQASTPSTSTPVPSTGLPANLPPLPQFAQWPFMSTAAQLPGIQHSQLPGLPNPALANQLQAMIASINFPLLSQQFLMNAQALAMAPPLTKADEPILVKVLSEARYKRESYKDAINALHGKNGHGAHLWKDYYLDHKCRIDEVVESWTRSSPKPQQIRNQAGFASVKKPTPTSFETESPVAPSSVSKKPPKRRKTAHISTVLPKPAGRRETINSLSVPEPVYGDRLPPPNAEVKVPPPPSRSPTPPTTLIPHKGRGYKYTQDDRDFFHKFISWRLKSNPNLTRNDLCNLLAEKAPHHTAQSWASYWSNHHDVPDKILAAARGDDSGSSEDESIVNFVQGPSRLTYAESTSDEGEDDESDDSSEGDDKVDDDDNEDESITSYSESEMGRKGEAYTHADLYFMAKHIASSQNFAIATGRERWGDFAQKYRQRTQKSWTEGYRRFERRLDLLARKIQAKRNGSPNYKPSLQIGRRTVAAPKRKIGVDSEPCQETPTSLLQPVIDATQV